MSRYEFQRNDRTICVGWDNPMRTYFLQIINDNLPPDTTEETIELWLGGDFGEYRELEPLLEKANLEIPDELADHLRCDRDFTQSALILPPQIKKIC